jgi:hypothetical protein
MRSKAKKGPFPEPGLPPFSRMRSRQETLSAKEEKNGVGPVSEYVLNQKSESYKDDLDGIS